jgi:hypothetical protein
MHHTKYFFQYNKFDDKSESKEKSAKAVAVTFLSSCFYYLFIFFYFYWADFYFTCIVALYLTCFFFSK